MISFSRISKQYGRQVLFVDASFQLNPGEKVGLVGPNGSGKTTLFRMIVGEEVPDEGDVSVPKKLTIGYFRQDVEEMSGRSVLDEAILGSGRVGDLHHELEQLQHAMSDPAQRRRHGADPRALRRGAGGVRPPRRLRARSAGARSAARPRLRRRADRRRRRRAVGRLEDARRHGARAARPARRPADGRADQPSRHRVDHLARELPEVAARRAADDLARPRVHEPHRDEDRRDRRRRDHAPTPATTISTSASARSARPTARRPTRASRRCSRRSSASSSASRRTPPRPRRCRAASRRSRRSRRSSCRRSARS